MATHSVYCVRAEDPVRHPDPLAEHAVPVCRDDGQALAANIRPDGALLAVLDGLRISLALPPLIDGQRGVGQIGVILSARGTRLGAFRNAWRQAYAVLERINRLLLVPPA